MGERGGKRGREAREYVLISESKMDLQSVRRVHVRSKLLNWSKEGFGEIWILQLR